MISSKLWIPIATFLPSDGKWRYVLFDLDLSFIIEKSGANAQLGTLNVNKRPFNPIIYNLFKNDEFTEYFYDMAGYLPNSDNIGSVLQALYSMTFDGVAVLGPTDEDLDAYGLSNPAHEFAFIYKDAQGQEWSNHFVVSEKTEDGMYYGYSEIYDMIVRIPESQATYLEWEEIDWYEREYFMFNIAHVQQIKLEGAGITTPIVFTLDNSKSDQSKGLNCSEKRLLRVRVILFRQLVCF